jgi:hypothetical protein
MEMKSADLKEETNTLNGCSVSGTKDTKSGCDCEPKSCRKCSKGNVNFTLN